MVLLKRFNQFQCTIYIPHFLASSIGADAPFNDISLYRKLESYRVHDAVIAEQTLETLHRHGWFLTPQIVPFSLISNKLTKDEK